MTFPAPMADREAMQEGPMAMQTPSGASLAGESGGGHEQTGMPTCAGMAADAPPEPVNGGRPV